MENNDDNIENSKAYIFIALIALVLGLIIGYSFKFWGHDKMPQKHIEQNIQNHTMSMKDLMSSMTANLSGKSGDEFNKAFLDEMIVHHEGAIAMARLVLANSKKPELLKLANDIIVAQTREINMMKAWRDTWFKIPVAPAAPSTPLPSKPAPSTPPKPAPKTVACTMEARICSDGSYVGRQGPNCEFAPCPTN